MTQPQRFEQLNSLFDYHLFGTMANLEMLSPFFLTDALPISPNNGSVLVSTNIWKLTEEKGNDIARMLALHIHLEQIALLTGLSLHSVYCVHENCHANGGIYKFFKMPSWAGWPQLITEDDINVSIYLVPIFSLLNPNIQYILGLLQFHCDFLLDELQVHLREFHDLDVSISTIWWALQNARLTWKKVLVLLTILALSLIFKLLS